ncbi:MAG TPA: hypothetical protein VHN55_00015 [Sphingomicrobium sp.]|nr:hypothetical protein [Sphingomicrobium sp.]
MPGPIAGATRHSGSFAEENGCIVFKSATSSANLTPVFPKGQTVLVSDGWQTLGMYLKGSPLTVKTPYAVAGAVARGPHDGIALAKAAPASCPDTYFVVQGVHKDLRAEADVWPLCMGTLLCTAIRLR